MLVQSLPLVPSGLSPARTQSLVLGAVGRRVEERGGKERGSWAFDGLGGRMGTLGAWLGDSGHGS